MAILNYTQRLNNIQNRRFDKELNESLLSKSFSRSDIPEDVKYMFEAMQPISKKSTERTLDAAARVHKHLENGFNLNFSRAYRNQGSVMSDTHIKASDFDFLAIIDRYHYVEPSMTVYSPYEGVPADDLVELRKQAVKIMKATYDVVDDTHEKCISIFNKALNRKIDIVFGFWYNTTQYESSSDEFYRGIKFKTYQSQPDYPFAHIRLVNNKGTRTYDGSRKGIRLLKTLKDDCETKLEKIKSFHLTSIVHSIEDGILHFAPGNEIKIAKSVSAEMQKILDDFDYRKSIKSPNGIETPLANDNLVADIKRLKEDLDILIEDASKDIYKSYYLQKAILSY
jgi:hypothetical protein